VRMYHVGFAFKKESYQKVERINEALSVASLDWIRYSRTAWIAYADSPETLHINVREAIDKGDQFLVIPLDLDAERQGLLSPWIWKWLNVDRRRPNWRDIVEQIDYPRPAPPPPSPPMLAPTTFADLLKALQPPKDESK
jgi:hypothetical protein